MKGRRVEGAHRLKGTQVRTAQGNGVGDAPRVVVEVLQRDVTQRCCHAVRSEKDAGYAGGGGGGGGTAWQPIEFGERFGNVASEPEDCKVRRGTHDIGKVTRCKVNVEVQLFDASEQAGAPDVRCQGLQFDIALSGQRRRGGLEVGRSRRKGGGKR